jgi:ribosome-binding factor A
MKKTRRSSQVGDTIRTDLSVILQRELNDPAIGFVTVTDVELSPDLQYARVFVSSLKSEAEAQEALKALQKANGRIRFLLGQRAKLRFTPQLEFRLDTTAARASNIEQILHDVLPSPPETAQTEVSMPHKPETGDADAMDGDEEANDE